MKKSHIFYVSLFFLLIGCQQADQSKIDRKSLVNRHTIVINEPDNLAPLSVGNGKFRYTTDITGMQTFPDYYQAGILLSTMSEWGWHSFSNREKYELSDTYEYVETYKDFLVSYLFYCCNANLPSHIIFSDISEDILVSYFFYCCFSNVWV